MERPPSSSCRDRDLQDIGSGDALEDLLKFRDFPTGYEYAIGSHLYVWTDLWGRPESFGVM
jgi:hypothetical protein